MGTSASIEIYGEDKKILTEIQIHSDGYDIPDFVKKFCDGKPVVKGFSSDDEFNGMGDLAARLIANLKTNRYSFQKNQSHTKPGGVYVNSPNTSYGEFEVKIRYDGEDKPVLIESYSPNLGAFRNLPVNKKKVSMKGAESFNAEYPESVSCDGCGLDVEVGPKISGVQYYRDFEGFVNYLPVDGEVLCLDCSNKYSNLGAESDYEESYDDLLDEMGESAISNYSVSWLLQQADPIAYEVGLNDYESFMLSEHEDDASMYSEWFDKDGDLTRKGEQEIPAIYDESLDEMGTEWLANKYNASWLLKRGDPIAYGVGLSDYESSMEEDFEAESFAAPSHCASCGWNLVQVPIGTETKWGVAIEGNQYYYNHNACKGIGKLPIKAESFSADDPILSKEEFDALMGRFDSMTMGELYMIRHQIHSRLKVLGMDFNKYNAESFSADSQTRVYRNLGIGAALVVGLAYWFKR